MPKRSCPFAESNRPQLKNHIGNKEVNMGVMMNEKMKVVYDKTLSMMFEASKGLSSKENAAPSHTVDSVSSGTVRVLPGQRKLNFSGQLEGMYSTEPKQSSSSHRFVPISCSSCGNQPSFSRVCRFCERCLCEYCSRDCAKCLYAFCDDCATIRYQEGRDVYICYSCI